MKYMLYILVSIIIIFSEMELFSQERSQISNDSTKFILQKEVFINYTKRSIPAKDANPNDLYKDGNNFIGVGAKRSIFPFLNNSNYDLVFSTGFQFGNINGNFALDMFFKPTFVVKTGLVEVEFSTGITILASGNDLWKYGGYGVNPEIGINYHLIKFFKFRFFYGVELYPNISYISTGVGIGYLF